MEKDNQKQKEIFAKNLNYWMNTRGKTQMDLMNDLNLSSSTVSDWCNAKKYPRMGTVQMLADYLEILKSDLIEERHKKTDKIPVLGIVKAGYDYLAEENIIGYVTVNDNSLKSEDCFALKVKGNSMVPEIYENDIAIIKKQSDFENGDYVVALINGDEATLKRAYKTDTGLLLQPVNPSFAPLIFDKNDINTLPVEIIGVLYNITRSFK
ncbi:sOS-response transcriptional repressor LexA [Clostridium sp. CAG:452]|nr:sOS-response transcriptional repressor LexA [Clostridium sp. CAG:452]